jgi:hypothetical protein
MHLSSVALNVYFLILLYCGGWQNQPPMI